MTESLLKAAPDTASVSGDGVTVALADGPHEVRFSARAIIRVENTWGTHEDFLVALETTPVGTLASLLLYVGVAKDEDAAMALLDGVNWPVVRSQVLAAWRKANWMPEVSEVPTTGA